MKSLKEIDTPEFLSSEIFLNNWIKSIFCKQRKKHKTDQGNIRLIALKKNICQREKKRNLNEPETYDVLYARPCGLRMFKIFLAFFLFFSLFFKKRSIAVEQLFVRTLRKIVFFYLGTKQTVQKKLQKSKLKEEKSKTEMISCRI